jgi:hypothetical protein
VDVLKNRNISSPAAVNPASSYPSPRHCIDYFITASTVLRIFFFKYANCFIFVRRSANFSINGGLHHVRGRCPVMILNPFYAGSWLAVNGIQPGGGMHCLECARSCISFS